MSDKRINQDQEIAWIIENYRPDQYDDVIRTREEWPFFLHLSSLREALLNWYPFEPGWRVLEVGGGFGALSGCLAERTAGVDVVEGDSLRSGAIRRRYEGNRRIRVLGEEILQGPEKELYDCVVLIDRLDEDDHRRELADRCAALLRPGGVLLVGFRNRFGMKYLCGAVDDRQEKPFDQLSPETNRLLTRGGADALLKAAGLEESRWYYPMPDQFFTQAVYTDSVQSIESIRDRVFPFDPFGAPRIAEERELYDDVIHEGMLPELANYYLAEYRKPSDAGGPDRPRPVEFAALSTDRGREHGFATICYADGTVEKKALFPEGIPNLTLAWENLEKISRRGVRIVPQELCGDRIRMPMIREPSALKYLREKMAEGPEAVIAFFEELRADVLASSELAELDEKECWTAWGVEKDKIGPVLAEGMIDMIPYNAFRGEDGLRYYDQEFRVPRCPVGYILFRAIFYTWIHLPEMEARLPIREMKKRFGLEETWAAFDRREKVFVNANRNTQRFAQLYRWAGAVSSKKKIRRAREALILSDPRERERELAEKIHRVQLDLIKKLDQVCREHGLRYFAIHGTLLGAVRHGGFVPWDDDVDIAMPREDYDRLLQLPQTVWEAPFFLQTPENNDDCFYGGYAKLRNSQTTAIEPQNRGRTCHQGIWIDLLPLDRCPESEKGRSRLQRRITRWQRFLMAKLYKPDTGMLSDVDPRRLSFYYLAARCLRRRWILRRMEQLFHSGKPSGQAAILACYYGERANRNVYPAEAFAAAEEMPFEDFSIPVPTGYDTILSERYGSHYMDLPGEAQRYRHGKVEFAVDRPWWKPAGGN